MLDRRGIDQLTWRITSDMRAGFGIWPRFIFGYPLEWALGLLVLGSRLWVFSHAGSPLPYYDQWLAEFNNTFLLLAGDAGIWSVLITPHNEHILLTTKIASLVGFQLNGYWDVEFLGVLSGFVRAAVAVMMFRLVTTGAEAGAKKITWVACVVIFALPLSGYNVLCGLQISFYFAELALLWSLRCVLEWSSGWKSASSLALGCLAGLLSLGSAVAIPPATLAVHLAASRKRPGFWGAWTLTVLVTGLYVGILVSLQPPKSNPTSIWSRVAFFAELYSWPLLNWACGLALLGLTVFAIIRLIGEGGLQARPVAAMIGVGVFAGGNILLIALNRSAEEFHMRHWETVSLLPLVLVALAAGAFSRSGRSWRWGRWMLFPLGASYLAAMGWAFQERSWPYIESARAHRDEALAHYHGLLVSGRIAEERARMNALLAARDYSFFDDPVGRFSLHPVAVRNFLVAPLPAMALLAPEILPLRPPSAFGRVVRALKQSGWLVLIVGVGLSLIAMIRCERIAAPGEVDPDLKL